MKNKIKTEGNGAYTLSEKSSIINFAEENTYVYHNIDRKIIVITEDKLEKNTMRFKSNVAEISKISREALIALGSVSTLLTSDFHDYCFFTKEIIEFIFLLIFFITVGRVLFMGCVIIYHRYCKKDKAYDEQAFVSQCRDGENNYL